MVVLARGGRGGVKTQDSDVSWRFFQFLANNMFWVRDRVGCVWYIQKALEKGFSDMYGLWWWWWWGGGGVAAKKSYSAGNMDGSGNFGPFSGILKARNRILIRFGSDVQVFSPEPP